MKVFYLAAGLVSACLSTDLCAQQILPADTSLFLKLNPSARKSHIVSLGTVYTMSPDNMPVLVPYQKNIAAMPSPGIGKGVPPAPMPNPLFRRMPRRIIIK
ncbi:MAG: hypothetical protein H7Y27_16345 [Gemmatimonadaceae bacterium]|nr:hypothetical protein [Chitinophagaceae bacterium]